MKFPQIKIKVSLTKGEKVKIQSPEDAHNVFRKLFSKDTLNFSEEMVMLALNRQNEVYGWYRVSSGGTTGTICDPKVIFSILLNAGASAFILAHNHPSNTLSPSDQDKEVTQKLKKAGHLLDIDFLDHLILTDTSFYSMTENGDM